MKRALWLVPLFLLVAAAWPQQKGTDLKNDISAAVTLTSNIRANAAATGAWVDLTGYHGAVAVIERGLVEHTSQYAVLQDSASGVAVAAVDSANIAADSTTTELAYDGYKRFVRILLRASGDAGDSSYVSAVIIRGFCDKKPC